MTHKNKFKRFLLASSVCSLVFMTGVGSSLTVAQDFLTEKYDPISIKEYDSINKKLPEYVGYQSKDRISTGYRENSVEVEMGLMRDAQTNAYVYGQDRISSGNLEDKTDKLEVSMHNYEAAQSLQDQAASWDENRLNEILGAQEFRQKNQMQCDYDNMSSRYSNIMCQYPNLTELEAQEILQIQERQEERNKWKNWSQTIGTEENVKEVNELADKYKDENGKVDVQAYAKDASSKALGATLAATAAFCMMDIPAAKSDPSGMCKKAICKIMGKWTCKAIF